MNHQRLNYVLFLALILFPLSARAEDNATGLLNKLLFPEGQKQQKVYAQPEQPPQAPVKSSLPVVMPVPDYISKKTQNLNSKEWRAMKLARDWKNRKINPVMHDNGKVLYVYGATMPTIICEPFMASDLELQAGETVNDVIVGDTARWLVTMGSSGIPGQHQAHIIIKPIDAGLLTSMVVTTDRRTYHLKLVSRRSGHTPYVGFIYPEEQKAAMRRSIERKAAQVKHMQTESVTGKQIDLTKLDFAYAMKGEARWKPLQIYNDGTHTVIRLPAEVAQTELPVLLVEKSGESIVVNYRFRRNSLLVDEVFDKAMLIAGVGSKQEKVEIIKVDEDD